MAEQELRPCPFCGGEKYRMIKPDGVWRVLCLTCKTEGRPSVMNIDAKSAWNKRPLETALEAINAELEKQNRALRHALECEETEHKPEIIAINSEQDYKSALAEVSRLMNAEPGSEDEARLVRLATLVEAYEDVHYPIPDESDPLDGVPFVSFSNAEIAAMTPEHPLYKLVKGDRKCKDE